MKEECVRFPDLNHECCALDPYETIVADYFESHSLLVERLCTARLPKGERTPDFRVADSEGWHCLCEVKKLTSSSGALSKSDWERANRIEFERMKAAAEEMGVRLVVHSEQYKLWKGEIPYPEEGRNTEEREREYERAIRGLLKRSPVAEMPFEVIAHRSDPFIWTAKERKAFVDELVEALRVLGQGRIPMGWDKNPFSGAFIGHFHRKRDDGRSIRNFVEVRPASPPLVFRSLPCLGVNWKAVARECSKARRQIRDRLKREPEPEKVARLVLVLLAKSLVWEYLPDMQRLTEEVNRRVLSRFSELSAVAFCKVTESHDAPQLSGSFLLFHTRNSDLPPVPRDVFDDESVIWVTQGSEAA